MLEIANGYGKTNATLQKPMSSNGRLLEVTELANYLPELAKFINVDWAWQSTFFLIADLALVSYG